MSVLLFAENSQGEFKKATLEAASYAYALAQSMGVSLAAVSIGQVQEDELKKLGNYGVTTVYQASSDQLNSFVNTAYAAVISHIAKKMDAQAVVMAQTYSGRAIAPRVAVKLEAAPISGAITVLDPSQQFQSKRMAYSGKGVQETKANKDRIVVTVMTNSVGVTENPVSITIEDADFVPDSNQFDTIAKELIKMSEGISLTEAESVVSAGRGMKGPENWPMIEELAGLLGAATACSKPVADMEWRPHHEHVGQTGIQIAPTLYIAIGISGAIQHLAGVSSSKHIVVINKDPEAPFFKIADYGIVGDLFEVVPRLIEAIKAVKVAQ